MNVLFLTLVSFSSLKERNIYSDLLREFVKNGHKVCVISPVEKRNHEDTHIIDEENVRILRLRIGNTQKTNIIEKGISTVMLEPSYKKAIRKYFSDTRFDLVLYSTPPITLVSAIEYVKNRDNAKTYLLLKDIFPQNAVDIGMMSTSGIEGLLYKHFRAKERKLYAVSDRIGCMSPANVEYVLKHNSDINPDTVEVCPNAIDIVDKSIDETNRARLRNRYKIPLDKKVFVYGGNLGKPQGIPFLIECLNECEDIAEAFFLIVGDGTDYSLIEDYIKKSKPSNLKLMKSLPKEDFDDLVGACDVGMVFLDHRFTIPNFPSRLLAYMQAKLPVLAVTDPNTDLGRIITENGIGWWSESNDSYQFKQTINEIIASNVDKEHIFRFLNDNYSSLDAYKIIWSNVQCES